MTKTVIPRSNKWQPFYNTSVKAAYHFQLILVTLDDVDDNIIKACKKNAPAGRNKVLSLASHEYCHWLDHVSSLWGREMLFKYFKGLSAREAGKIEDFYWMVEANKSVNRATSNQYYFYKGPKSKQGSPWSWTLSIGQRFNSEGEIKFNDPIPFIRFGKGDPLVDANLVARMPISAAALAESRAMMAELLWIKSEIETFGEKSTPASVEDWLNNYKTKLYKDDYLVYTTSVHLLANQTDTFNLEDCLPFASALSWLCLNFPHLACDKIKIPDVWSKAWINEEKKIDYITPLLENRDPGFLFSLFCENASKPTDQNIRKWLNQVVKSVTTYDLGEIEDMWNDEIEQRSKIMKQSCDNDQFLCWLEKGKEWSQKIGITGDISHLIEEINGTNEIGLPPALNIDESPWTPSPNKAYECNFNSLQERVDYMIDKTAKIDEFIEVCGL